MSTYAPRFRALRMAPTRALEVLKRDLRQNQVRRWNWAHRTLLRSWLASQLGQMCRFVCQESGRQTRDGGGIQCGRCLATWPLDKVHQRLVDIDLCEAK